MRYRRGIPSRAPSPRGRRSAGFTVVDGAIVLAVLAVLASIGVAEYQAMEVRKRFAERDDMLRRIVQAVENVPRAEGSGGAPLAGTWNPAVVPGPRRVPWEQDREGWKRLGGLAPDAAWCSYEFVLDESRTPALLVVAADCDVDGDGAHNVKVQAWTRSGRSFALSGETGAPTAVF